MFNKYFSQKKLLVQSIFAIYVVLIIFIAGFYQMVKKHSNNIERKEIQQVALDLGIFQQTKGLLLFKHNAEELKAILLKKPFRSAQYSFVFVQEGEISIRINMFDYVLTGNKIFFASPSAIKEFKSISDDCILTVILFTNDYVLHNQFLHNEDISNVFINNTHYFIDIGSESFDELEQLVSLMDRRLKKHSNIKKVTNLLFFAVLNLIEEVLIAQDVLVLPKETKSRSGNLVLHFFQLLPKYIREHRDIQFYASMLNVNAKYLSHTLKEKNRKNCLFVDCRYGYTRSPCATTEP